MRTEIVQAAGFTITVRGRSRRTLALESEYMVQLKQNHPDMKAWVVDANGSVEVNLVKDPRGVSMSGVASSFRYLLARCASIENSGSTIYEPYPPDQLVALFNNYLDTEALPDGKDIWSLVEDAITRMDTPDPVTDPNGDGGLPMKLPL